MGLYQCDFFWRDAIMAGLQLYIYLFQCVQMLWLGHMECLGSVDIIGLLGVLTLF